MINLDDEGRFYYSSNEYTSKVLEFNDFVFSCFMHVNEFQRTRSARNVIGYNQCKLEYVLKCKKTTST